MLDEQMLLTRFEQMLAAHLEAVRDMLKAPQSKGFQKERLLSQQQAAEFLGFSERTLEGWRYRGEGPIHVKVGGRVRYRMADLRAFAEEGSMAG